MKKVTTILSILLLCTFLVAGSAIAVPFNARPVAIATTAGEFTVQEIFNDIFTDDVNSDNYLNAYTDQSTVAIWGEAEVDIDAYFITAYAGHTGQIGIYSYSDYSLSYTFDLFSDGTASFGIDNSGTLTAKDANLTTTIGGFGEYFGFYWYDSVDGSYSFTEDSRNLENTPLALSYLIKEGMEATFNDNNYPATGNNDWILAFGDGAGDSDFNDAVFYIEDMKPVPEPATMLLFGTGLIGLVAIGRKKYMKK